ncbi:Aminotransferase, DegT/DnrJ/EryC1/StrS family [hydrothermal vent metagenome]|uniref:Aminotransferase, DegT/DnrJ/EryC1/StrS family n=1 Tax=hydrothermal vent metagenome TaxID=652676 RepID=A0A3B1DB69_9ZZZZ
MNVPFIDFKEQYYTIREEIDAGLKAVFEKGNFILGEETKNFENDFAKYCDAQYGIGVNSGTDALYLALGTQGIGLGDEVILPTFTFIATALCISYTGAKPVFVDVEEHTYNIDPQKFKEAITEKTKAIILVHLYGQPANMDEINAIAKENNITVIEDACQAHGSNYKGKRVGSLGDIACFSFYPTKSLGAFGDGGMIVTNSKVVCEKAVMLRDYGRESRYDHTIKGFNSRLDTIQAVILAAKLKHLDGWNKLRNENAAYYAELLKDVDGVYTPTIQEDRGHVFQTYAIRLPGGHRDEILEKMKEKGVGVLIHYPIPLHLQTAYKDSGHKKGDFPVAEKLSDEVLSLPMFPHMQKEQMDYVCESLKEILPLHTS